LVAIDKVQDEARVGQLRGPLSQRRVPIRGPGEGFKTCVIIYTTLHNPRGWDQSRLRVRVGRVSRVHGLAALLVLDFSGKVGTLSGLESSLADWARAVEIRGEGRERVSGRKRGGIGKAGW